MKAVLTLTLLCIFPTSHQATLNVRAGQYLGVDGRNFVYGGDRVKRLERNIIITSV